MFILILVGLVLYLIHPIAGGIYTSAILIGLTIGLIIKEEKRKRNQ